MKLEDLRKKIDSVDEKILANLAERMTLAKEIKKIKAQWKLSVEDKNREMEIINNRKNRGEKLGLSLSFVSQIFKLILKESKRIQQPANSSSLRTCIQTMNQI